MEKNSPLKENGNNSSEISEHIMFETIMENSLDSIYFKDKNSRFIYHNKHKAFKHGIKNEEGMIGKTDFDYFYEKIAKSSLESEQEILKTGNPVIGMIEKLDRLDGKTTWSSTSKYPLYGKKGNIIGTWGISRDITEYERAKEALEISEAKNKAMIENISDVILVYDKDGIITYVSPNIEKLFGYEPEEILGRECDFIFPPAGSRRKLKDFLSSLERKKSSTLTECRLMHKDGTFRIVEMTTNNLLNNSSINGILINLHDISERKKWEEEIVFLSYHDTLTGLFNRAFFDEEKKRLDTERQLPLTIVMGDVDGLKLTNDTFGHSEGDRLIIEIANILKACCRKEDIVSRIGGDEFCILLPHTSYMTAQKICDRISRKCREHKDDSDKKTIYPSISLGYATKTEINESLNDIQKNAEDFMYRRKLLEHKSVHSSILSSIKATMNERSHETEEHSERMIALSKTVGEVLSLSGEQITDLNLLSTLHDIGKISVEENILDKPDKLTEAEWNEIKKHPEVGCRITQASSGLTRLAYYILCHHERWDGNGYPNGLNGEDIPLLSRIISVCDAYDAMTQDRPYRKAMPKEDAIREIKKNAGRQFDPAVAKIFVEKVLGETW